MKVDRNKNMSILKVLGPYIVTLISLIESAEINLCEKSCSHPLSINCTTLDAEVLGRCCLKGKSQPVVAGRLDLSSCHITSIENMFHNMNNLQIFCCKFPENQVFFPIQPSDLSVLLLTTVIYLQNNSLKIPKVEAFIGLTQLKLLKLPPKLPCPGGIDLWNHTEVTSDSVICIDELSSCTVYNVSCPNKNSYCTDVGPQMTECLCKPGYHGYKCLRKDTFPTLTFVIGLGVSTVVVSGLLWITQRRKAKKQV